MLVLVGVADFLFLVGPVLRHVVICIQYNWKSNCTLELMVDRALGRAYEAMVVDLWRALLSALSS